MPGARAIASQGSVNNICWRTFDPGRDGAIQEQQEIIKSLELRIETLEKSANVSL